MVVKPLYAMNWKRAAIWGAVIGLAVLHDDFDRGIHWQRHSGWLFHAQGFADDPLADYAIGRPLDFVEERSCGLASAWSQPPIAPSVLVLSPWPTVAHADVTLSPA